ncbi:DUF943 family protein [Cronobacter sakazakii]|uniref:DUF943 family protein n=1 Tax=Cronobacter sakazakii TaxID=28141 RepID=UPI0013762A77|nr:DUF943 family protein [Cronobacter sakazakii]ELY2643124.1 DUF943 family protein [Cronobacter sakazakii]ELY4543158.1 DUF943 family protein [Cronobacter sakazakii]ELY4591315.1 DUF943 family protein [Cronobacter sakazakii]ELY4814825.1 DUF943 family protein [Cronobacter sakazakii]ELY4859869.1 DUF943 family protein [Cronobacter sakazakii]
MLKKILFALLLICVARFCWDFFAPTEIIRVADGKVYINHPPLTDRGKIDWWNKNKDNLQEKYHLIDNPEDFTITIMYFGGYVAAPTGSNDGIIDDYNCFDDIKSDENCIYNDVVMRVGGDYSSKVFFGLNGKLYRQTPDGKLTLLETH